MEDKNPFERINKLRTIGIEMTNPIVKADSTEVTFTAAFALPKEKTIDTPTSFTDTGWNLSQGNEITFDNNITYNDDYGPIRIATFSGKVTVPFIEESLFTIFQGVVRVRYGMKVTSESEVENVVANFLVVKEGDESLQWKAPTVTITTEDTISYAEEIDLVATITKEQEETLKVTWFVSSGKLKNRTAKETKWLEAEKGEQTIIFAVYPRKSQFFKWVAKKVTIQ